MRLGATILTLRSLRGWTQETLAFEAGTNAGYISRIEKGKCLPSLSQLEKIAAALETRVSAIYAAAEGEACALPEGFAEESGELAASAAQLRLGFLELSPSNQQVVLRFAKMLAQMEREGQKA